jgi:hypothetical protein
MKDSNPHHFIITLVPVWKAIFTKEILSSVTMIVSATKRSYAKVLSVDERLMQLELPVLSKGKPPVDGDLLTTMYYYTPLNCREHGALFLRVWRHDNS